PSKILPLLRKRRLDHQTRISGVGVAERCVGGPFGGLVVGSWVAFKEDAGSATEDYGGGEGGDGGVGGVEGDLAELGFDFADDVGGEDVMDGSGAHSEYEFEGIGGVVESN
ncbi:hypothetical protein GP486_008817, partial [Trichoglossum hirsutum]